MQETFCLQRKAIDPCQEKPFSVLSYCHWTAVERDQWCFKECFAYCRSQSCNLQTESALVRGLPRSCSKKGLGVKGGRTSLILDLRACKRSW